MRAKYTVGIGLTVACLLFAGCGGKATRNLPATQPPAAPAPTGPLMEQEYNDFSIQLIGCHPQNGGMRFDLKILNSFNQSREFVFNRHKIQIIDDEGNVYATSSVTFGGSHGEPGGAAFVRENVMYNVPMKATLTIISVPEGIRLVKALQIGVSYDHFDDVVIFRDITVR